MQYFTLSLASYPDFHELGKINGTLDSIKSIFLSLLHDMNEDEIIRHQTLFNSPFQSVGLCLKYSNGTILSVDISTIDINESKIPAAFVANSKFTLSFIFPQDGLFIETYLHRRVNDFECVENLRVALKSNPESVALYEEAEENGCCASFDEELKIGQKIYLIGFNYGN